MVGARKWDHSSTISANLKVAYLHWVLFAIIYIKIMLSEEDV